MRKSWKKVCGVGLLVSAIGSSGAEKVLNSATPLPPGEPLEYVKPATNSSAPSAAATARQPARTTSAQQDTVPQPTFPGAYVSPWVLDTVKLAQAGIDQGVILNFIDSAGTFNLTAEQIIFLRD